MKHPQIHLEIAVLALGLLLAAAGVRATKPSEVDSSANPVGEPFAPDAYVSLRGPLQSSENFSFGAVTESPDGEPSASELNRKLTNPVSDIWSIANQFNNFELNNGHWNNNWNFQPVLPISLTKDRNLITQVSITPVLPKLIKGTLFQ